MNRIDELEEQVRSITNELGSIDDLDMYQEKLTELTYLVTQLYRESESYREHVPVLH